MKKLAVIVSLSLFSNFSYTQTYQQITSDQTAAFKKHCLPNGDAKPLEKRVANDIAEEIGIFMSEGMNEGYAQYENILYDEESTAKQKKEAQAKIDEMNKNMEAEIDAMRKQKVTLTSVRYSETAIFAYNSNNKEVFLPGYEVLVKDTDGYDQTRSFLIDGNKCLLNSTVDSVTDLEGKIVDIKHLVDKVAVNENNRDTGKALSTSEEKNSLPSKAKSN